MDNQPPKSARDEMLESVARNLPVVDPFREHQRIVDAMQRVLGREASGDAVPPGQASSEAVAPVDELVDAEGDDSADMNLPTLDLSATDALPTAISSSADPATFVFPSDIEVGAPAISPFALSAAGAAREDKLRSVLDPDLNARSESRDPTLGPTDELGKLFDVPDAARLLPRWLRPEADADPTSPSVGTLPQPKNAPPGTSDLMPHIPSQSKGGIEVFSEPMAQAKPQSDATRSFGEHTPQIAPPPPTTTKDTEGPSQREPDVRRSRNKSASAESTSLPSFPVLIVQLEDPSQMIRAEMEALGREIEQLAGDIAQKRVDDYAYRQFVEMRALHWLD